MMLNLFHDGNEAATNMVKIVAGDGPYGGSISVGLHLHDRAATMALHIFDVDSQLVQCNSAY